MKRLIPCLTPWLACAFLACDSAPSSGDDPVTDAAVAVDGAITVDATLPDPDAAQPDVAIAPTPDAAPPIDPTPVDRDPSDPVEVIPDRPPIEPEPDPARPRRRMNLDQLDAAIRAVSGGIGWEEGNAANPRNLFVTLSATLGKPDFVQQTTEDLEASALFQKFLDDAARSVCDKMIDAGDTLIRPNGDEDAHLAALIRRFHGRAVTADAPEIVAWRWLYDSAEFVSEAEHPGWRSVCVALFTHPDFYSY